MFGSGHPLAGAGGGLTSPVAFADIETVAQSRILGRAASAGTGEITELTAAQVKTILDLSYSTDYRVMPVRVCADTEDLVVGTANATFHVFPPLGLGWSLYQVCAAVTTAPTGSGITIDVNDDGASIFTTRITIDSSEATTETAAAAAVLTATPRTVARASVMTIDIDAVGSTTPGKGLVLYFIFKEV